MDATLPMPHRPHRTGAHFPRLPRWFWITLVLLALLLIGVGAQEWRGWPWLRGPIERKLTAQLHHPVRFRGDFALHLLGGLRLNVGALEIGQPAWNATTADVPLMLQADAVELLVPYGGLFSALRHRKLDALRIDDIALASLSGDLKRDATGRANWWKWQLTRRSRPRANRPAPLAPVEYRLRRPPSRPPP